MGRTFAAVYIVALVVALGLVENETFTAITALLGWLLMGAGYTTDLKEVETELQDRRNENEQLERRVLTLEQDNEQLRARLGGI